MIVGHGKNTDIFFIEDYGTDEDYQSGRAITGMRESVLRQLLSDHGIKQVDQIYRTLYIKDKLTYMGRAKKKRVEALKEAEAKVFPLNYYEILKREILDFQPRVLVPLGDLSLKLLANESSVSKFRGSVLPLVHDIQKDLNYPVRVIPTMPLLQLAFDYTSRVFCSLDIAKAIKNRNNPEPITDNLLIWICKNAEEAKNYFARIAGAEFVTFDIETIFGIPDCIGFCHNGREGVCFPLINDPTIDRPNRALMLKHIIDFLQSYVPKANQNVKYDQTILERFLPCVNNVVYDTQIAAGLIYPELPKNLGFLTSIYTDMPYFKDEGKEFDPKIHDRSRHYIYNAKDCISTWQVAVKQKEELEELGLKNLYYGRGFGEKEPETNPLGMMKLYHIYRRIDRRGIQIDAAKRDALRTKYQIILEVSEAKLRALLGKDKINVNSPQQVGDVIYEELGFPARRKQTEGGKVSWNTEEEILEELAIFHPENSKAGRAGKEILELFIFCRKLYKLLQTIDTPVHYDDRMRCNYNLSGTENGRTSANKTLDEYFILDNRGKVVRKRLGHSLQTLGKHGFKFQGQIYGDDIREMFVPSPGKIFVEADLSQAEARVDAVLAEDYDILARFDDQWGIHRLTASWVYSCSPADIKKGTEEYHIGKTVRHAAERNMQPPRLAMMIQKPLGFCTQLLNKFHATQPKIRNIFHQDIRNIVKRTRLLQAPNGRRRDFFGKLDENLYNEAISFLPQAIVGDQTKFSMIPFSEDDPEFPWLMEAHDGVLCELDKDQLEPYAIRYKRIAERPINFLDCSLSRDFELMIPVEIEYSDTNWHEMRKLQIGD